MEPAAAPTSEDRYPESAVIGAALAVFFFPLISLIVALLLMGQQSSEAKRSQLQTLAWVSGAWIAAQMVVALFFFAVVVSSMGGLGVQFP